MPARLFFSLCSFFPPSPHFFPSAALSCECWSCCTRGFWWSTLVKWERVEPYQWQKQSLLKSEALLRKCSLWAQSNDHWLYKSLSAPAHFIIFVLVLLHPSFQKHLAALQPGQSQRSNCALIYRQQSSTCTASEPVGPCSLQTASASAWSSRAAFWSILETWKGSFLIAGSVKLRRTLSDPQGAKAAIGILQWSICQKILMCQTLSLAKTIKLWWQP